MLYCKLATNLEVSLAYKKFDQPLLLLAEGWTCINTIQVKITHINLVCRE